MLSFTTTMASSIACNESRLIPDEKCSRLFFAQQFRSLAVKDATFNSASFETEMKDIVNKKSVSYIT